MWNSFPEQFATVEEYNFFLVKWVILPCVLLLQPTTLTFTLVVIIPVLLIVHGASTMSASGGKIG